MSADGIYVEIVIAGSIEDVWTRTQDPSLHQQWDLRFTSIEYLPRPDTAAPQRFLYATRVGFGLGIEGAGQWMVLATISRVGVQPRHLERA